jgi:hypothetical protein
MEHDFNELVRKIGNACVGSTPQNTVDALGTVLVHAVALIFDCTVDEAIDSIIESMSRSKETEQQPSAMIH